MATPAPGAPSAPTPPPNAAAAALDESDARRPGFSEAEMNKQAYAVAEAILRCGAILLVSGCQVRTVEDTMVRFGRTFQGVDDCNAYVTLTGIIVSVTADDDTVTKIVRIDSVSHDLWAVARTLHLAHRCEKDPMTPDQVMAEIQNIENAPLHGNRTMALAWAVGALGCAIFYGYTGPMLVTFAAVAVGALATFGAGLLSDRLLPNPYVGIIVQAGVATGVCVLFHRFFPTTDMESMLIPILMLLVPGMTFTNSLLDTLSGDYLSGVARLSVALLVGVSIAIGTSIVLHYSGVLTWSPS